MLMKYDSLLEKLDLNDIFIQKMDFNRISSISNEGPFTMQLGLSSGTPEYTQSEGLLTVKQPVSFEILKDSDDEKSKDKVFVLNAEYILVYSIDEEISEDLFSEYSKNNIPKLLHPYMRELISTSLGRVGMPPLTIPLFENI